MAHSDFSRFINQFSRRLLLAPVECQHERGAVYWIDPDQRVNWCWIENWAPEDRMRGLLLMRINVNLPAPESVRPDLPIMRRQRGWENIDRARPRWNRQVTCHREELEPIGCWLADFVNRREGLHGLCATPTVIVPMAGEDDASVTSGYFWTKDAHNVWRRAEAKRAMDRGLHRPVAEDLPASVAAGMRY
jgi:hypothetical protein